MRNEAVRIFRDAPRDCFQYLRKHLRARAKPKKLNVCIYFSGNTRSCYKCKELTICVRKIAQLPAFYGSARAKVDIFVLDYLDETSDHRSTKSASAIEHNYTIDTQIRCQFVHCKMFCNNH